eukprot:15477943-Alexandrium_andersonii.AAC.1
MSQKRVQRTETTSKSVSTKHLPLQAGTPARNSRATHGVQYQRTEPPSRGARPPEGKSAEAKRRWRTHCAVRRQP